MNIRNKLFELEFIMAMSRRYAGSTTSKVLKDL